MAVLALLLSAAAATAAAPAESCADPVTQLDMNRCAAEDYAKADAALNAQWAITRQAMRERDTLLDRTRDDRPSHSATLLAAQRAWITFRDKHCASAGFLYRGGSMEPLVVGTCKTMLTEQRTAQLADLVSAE